MSGTNSDRDDDYNRTSSTKRGTGSGGGGSDPCDFVDTAPLNSVQPAVVAELNVGAILKVALDTSGIKPVLQVLANGARAGALTHRNHVRIIRCIEAGRTYRAIVIAKHGGSIEVRIEPA